LAPLDASAEILVIDNGAGDLEAKDRRAAESVAHLSPIVRYLPQRTNRGFAGGAAVGTEEARGKYVLFLNNDALVTQGHIRDLLAAFETSPRVGAVCPVMVFASDPLRVNSAGIATDELGIAWDAHIGKPIRELPQEPFAVWGCSGGAALYSAEMLRAIGGFDPTFFLYYEDVDVAWRAQAAGWKAVCVPAVRVVHEHSSSTSHGSDLKLYWTGRNRVRTVVRNSNQLPSSRILARMVAYDALYVCYYAFRRRTLAPIRGRFAGLRLWRLDHSVPKGGNDPGLMPAAGVRAALHRNALVSRLTANATSTVGDQQD
jgi:GT2 family glycosyltransferase